MKRMIYPICLLAVLMVLAGCQLGKHYTRPKLDLPATLGSQTADDSASLADMAWEELYTDTLLQGLIRKTLEYNKDMQMAAARVKELAAMKRIDVANMFPQIGAKVYRGSSTCGATCAGHATRAWPTSWAPSRTGVPCR